MQEYISEAVVLGAYPNGDMDLRVSLFTKRFGKLVAKAKSARKITSKLAGHLQSGNLVQVRLVEKGGLPGQASLQVVDALKNSRLAASLPDLYFLDRLLAEAEPDLELWQAITVEPWGWRRILRILGWDPAEASCRKCGKKPEYFYPKDQEFFCGNCVRISKIAQDEVIFLS